MVASYAAQAQAEMIWKPTLWDQLEAMTWPRELAQEIKPFLLLAEGIEEVLAPMRERFPIPDVLDKHMRRMITDLAWTFAADLSVTRVTSELLANGDADLTLAYLAMPDVAGHRFWKYFQPGDVDYELAPEHIEAYADFIPLSYIAADRMLAQLIDKAGPETTVLVLSDHGMHVDPLNTDNPFALNSGAHEDAPDGIIGILGPLAAKRGNELARTKPIGHVGEVAALVLQLEQVPVPEDWPAAQQLRRQLEGLLDVDWRLEHPLTVAPELPEFRAATPSRLPMEGMDTAFYQNMQDLGYLGGPEDEQAEREQAAREQAEREKRAAELLEAEDVDEADDAAPQ
jgi:hypothetical protein